MKNPILDSQHAAQTMQKYEGGELFDVKLTKVICNEVLYPCWENTETERLYFVFPHQEALYEQNKEKGSSKEYFGHEDMFMVDGRVFFVFEGDDMISIGYMPEILDNRTVIDIARTHGFPVDEEYFCLIARTHIDDQYFIVWQLIKDTQLFQLPAWPIKAENPKPKMGQTIYMDIGDVVIKGDYFYTIKDEGDYFKIQKSIHTLKLKINPDDVKIFDDDDEDEEDYD